jgi:hypothetical protein
MTVPDNAVADDQAQAGAAADGFRGEKGLEHARLDIGRNPGTVVHNFDYQLVIFPAGADANLADAIYSGDRIINEIGPNLIQFTSVSLKNHRQLRERYESLDPFDLKDQLEKMLKQILQPTRL